MRALELADLWVAAPGPGGRTPLLRGVGLSLAAGEVAGLVGLSGAGKSLTARALAGLLPPPLVAVRGRLRLAGREVPLADPAGWRGLRGREVLLLFQQAGAALNPVMGVGAQIEEALRAGRGEGRAGARRRSREALARVGLDPALAVRRPPQLSGGQRQRVLLALAFALAPPVLLADEPTTGLDPAAQEGILALLAGLAQEAGSAVLFISHDLRAARTLCRRLAVMAAGRVVEAGATAAVLARAGPPPDPGVGGGTRLPGGRRCLSPCCAWRG